MNKAIAAVYLFVVGLVVLLGVYLLVRGMSNVQKALASTRWPVTSGIVVSSETTRDATPDRRKRTTSVIFSTKTVIQYAVNGHEYTTEVLHFGQTLGSSDKSEAALQRLRYPVDAKVPVSYNPQDPSIGVMKPGLHAEAFWLPGAGLAFLLPAALCLAIGPALFREIPRGLKSDDRAFADSVNAVIEAGRRGETPPEILPPPRGNMDPAMSLAAAVFGAVFCCLGMLALTAGLQRVWHGHASESWPTTGGSVIFANKGGGENGEDLPDDSSDMGARARFVYQYDVAGVTHFNNLRQFAQAEGGDREEADRIAARYRKGASVKVSYFPTDPDIAVLEPGNTSDALWLPGIGLVLILFSAAVFIWVVPAVAKPV